MFEDLKFKPEDFIGQDVESLPDQVSGQGEFLKKRFDNVAKNMIALGKWNELIDIIGYEYVKGDGYEYWKYNDGRLVILYKGTLSITTAPTGSIFYANTPFAKTFPVPFVGDDAYIDILATGELRAGNFMWVTTVPRTFEGTMLVGVLANSQVTNTSTKYSIKLEGRWK